MRVFRIGGRDVRTERAYSSRNSMRQGSTTDSDAVRGDVTAQVETFVRDPRPVGDEEPLQVLHGVALDAEVLVAPLAHVISVEVVFRNIYATQKGDTAVRDDYFAVVAA